MTLLFATGFDLYDGNTANQFWSGFTGTINSTNSRWSTGQGASFNNTAGTSKTWGTNEGTLVVGFAFLCNGISSAGTSDMLRLYDSGTIQVSLAFTSTGQLAVYRGGSGGTQLAATSAGFVVSNIWHYYEMKIVFSNTGSYEVRVDGNATPTLSGSADTTNTANNFANQLGLFSSGGGGSSTFYDDIYLVNSAGALNNDFLGDTRIEGLVPTGAGGHTDWTPSTGSNWQNVDEVPPNDNTDYNYTATVSNIDTYAMHDLTSLSGTIRAILHTLRTRKDDAGTRKVAPVFRISGTDYVGTDQVLSTSFQTIQQLYELSPATSAAWTVSEVNALEAGVKLTA